MLRADAKHTRSDVLTTGAVLGALLGVWWGYPLLDPLAALLVAGFIGHACWSIAQEASRILADEIVIAEGEVRDGRAVRARACSAARRSARAGSADYAFLDLHLWLDGDMPLKTAHADLARRQGPADDAFPHLADVVIHIEPPPLKLPTPKAQRPTTPNRQRQLPMTP